MNLSKQQFVTVVTGILLVAIAIVLATLPRDWIEANLGFEPDAGSGVIELALVVVPFVLGLALLTRVGRALLHSRTRKHALTDVEG